MIRLKAWMGEQSLPLGTLAYDFADPATGEQQAVLALASAAGFRCFTTPSAFRAYVEREILGVPA